MYKGKKKKTGLQNALVFLLLAAILIIALGFTGKQDLEFEQAQTQSFIDGNK
jgi:hypothetical protein